MHASPRTAGYTLVELLLYVSVVGGLLMSVIGFLTVSAEARIKSQSVVEVNRQGEAVMEMIAQTVRNASDITSPAAGATGVQLTTTAPTGQSPIVYSLNGTTLQVREGTDAAVPLTNSKVAVTNLSVQNLTRSGTPGVVKISFTLSRVNTAGRNEYEYQKTFTTSVARRSP